MRKPPITLIGVTISSESMEHARAGGSPLVRQLSRTLEKLVYDAYSMRTLSDCPSRHPSARISVS